MSSKNNSPKLFPREETNIDWSTHKTDTDHFNKRLGIAYMGNSWLSDMTFLLELENVSIPGHSNIVAAASPVLEKCIFGTGTIVNKDRVVRIPDCSQQEFEVLLRYIYTGKMFVSFIFSKCLKTFVV